MIRTIVLLAAVFTAGSVNAQAPSSRIMATASLQAADGTSRGEATLAESGDVVTVTVKGIGFPPGDHGAHLHAIGKCEAPGFTSAGPHLNPMAKMHA